MSNLRENRLSFNKNVQISSKSEVLSSHVTISGIAYNLIQLMKYLVFPKTEKKSIY